MPSPEVRYCTTEDGVRIAFQTMGSGPPLVFMFPPPFTHLHGDLQFPEFRELYERLCPGPGRMLVRYDKRGTGLSEREISNFSLEAEVADLEAVADGLRLDTFTILATMWAGPPAMAYAVRHPDRVSHLVLYGSHGRASTCSHCSKPSGR